MKPNGLTQTLNVIRPTPAEDAVWEAVQAARAAGWDPRRFRIEAGEAWQHEAREEAKHAAEELK